LAGVLEARKRVLDAGRREIESMSLAEVDKCIEELSRRRDVLRGSVPKEQIPASWMPGWPAKSKRIKQSAFACPGGVRGHRIRMSDRGKGRKFEHEIPHILKAHGVSVVRGTGSKGEFFGDKVDLIATKQTRENEFTAYRAVQGAEVRHVIGVTEDFFSRLITMRSRAQIAAITARSANRDNLAAHKLYTMASASAARKTNPMQIALCSSERKPNRRSGISLKTDRCLTPFHRF
jgi:Holliday junction resolvase